MKKTAWLISAIVIAGVFLMQGSGVLNIKNQMPVNAGELIYPTAVKKVIDQKCYGCHSAKGESQDAKDALMWDDLPNLEKGKMVATLDNIIGVLEDGTMPPEEVIEKYPEARLLPEERDVLHAWAEAKADSLLN
ncbi:MAG TPA: heme-binding domain-containing protein [Bacteroidales bacterium]|jgi:uncharacterized membrane protein|nr:heme-binding domain-containing protein [Bacteroidales bacterium]